MSDWIQEARERCEAATRGPWRCALDEIDRLRAELTASRAELASAKARIADLREEAETLKGAVRRLIAVYCDDVKPPAVTSTPGVRGGSPCLAGTRMPVGSVLSLVAVRCKLEPVLEDYPHLTVEQVRDALRWAAENADALAAPFEVQVP